MQIPEVSSVLDRLVIEKEYYHLDVYALVNPRTENSYRIFLYEMQQWVNKILDLQNSTRKRKRKRNE